MWDGVSVPMEETQEPRGCSKFAMIFKAQSFYRYQNQRSESFLICRFNRATDMLGSICAGPISDRSGL